MEGKLFEAGAKDVWRESIAMKKGRMGFKLSVLCSEGQETSIKNILYKETTAIGSRSYAVKKDALRREQVDFILNEVALSFKRVALEGEWLKYKIEHDALCRYALEKEISIPEAQRCVLLYLEENERWKSI